MNPITRSLLWKEWREHHWKVYYACVIISAFVAVGLRTRLLSDADIMTLALFIAAVLHPVFMAMGLVATERNEGSLESLLALPVSSRRILLIKVLVGAFGCLVPYMLAWAVALAIAGSREMSISDLFLLYSGAVGFSLTIFIGTLSLGIRQPTEARTGLVVIPLLLIWGLVMIVEDELLVGKSNLMLPFTPFGFFEGAVARADAVFTQTLCVQLLIGALLFFWAVYRFGKQGAGKA